MEIRNFGGNVCFRPATYVEPANEEEVLEVLRASRGRHIRTIGRLHAWSEAAKSDDVLLDVKHLDSVQIQESNGQAWVQVGAGCQLKQLSIQKVSGTVLEV